MKPGMMMNVNDEVTVIEKDDSGWWRGRLNDREGLFPSSCVLMQYEIQVPSVRFFTFYVRRRDQSGPLVAMSEHGFSVPKFLNTTC